MDYQEQVFFNVPLSRLEPIFKRWVKEVQQEFQPQGYEPVTPSDELLTIQQAAKFLNLSVPTMYGKVAQRSIPVMKRGKRLYFSRTELMDYLKGGRKKTTDEIEQEAKTYTKKKGGNNA